VELLVILTSFGLATAIIGKAKGSYFSIWFLVGFVLPFLGLIAVIAFPRQQDEPTRDCPRCGARHPLYVQVCNRCGLDMYLPESYERAEQH
jgi:hypothetical protein